MVAATQLSLGETRECVCYASNICPRLRAIWVGFSRCELVNVLRATGTRRTIRARVGASASRRSLSHKLRQAVAGPLRVRTFACAAQFAGARDTAGGERDSRLPQ